MRVLVVSGAFPPMPLAEANHALHLAEALAGRGIEVDVLTTRGAVTAGFPFRVHAVMRDWSWRDAPRFARFVRRCAPDAVLMVYIGFAYGEHPMATFAPTLAKAVRPGLPFVTQFENVMGASFHRWPLGTRVVRKLVTHWAGRADLDWELGSLLRDSDRVIVLGGRHQAQLAQRYPPVTARSVLIPPPPIVRVCPSDNGSARQAGRDWLRLKPDEFVLTYFGYIYASKGLETLLHAFHQVRRRGRQARLVIAGGVPAHLHDERISYLSELETLAATLGIQDDVVWTGLLAWDTDEASLCMHAADVCILPFDDGISMNNSTFGAAAAHGLPIVTTRAIPLEPPFRHEENVLLCPPRDPDSLAAAIETLMDRPGLREKLVAGIGAMRDEWFSWDRAAARIVATLTPGQ